MFVRANSYMTMALTSNKFCLAPIIFKSYQSLDLMRLPNEEVEILNTDSSPLVVEHPSFPARTSAEWLRQHGLKGNK